MIQYLVFQAANLKKAFGRNILFSDINFTLCENHSLAVTGRNGSGKTTLLKILAGLLSPTGGRVQCSLEGTQIDPANLYRHLGFVSPYLQLYDEFTAWENLDLFRRIRGIGTADTMLQELLERVNLGRKRNEMVRTFSSGMKQRLKYACALLHEPPILLLDEPTANLDAEGKSTVQSFVKEQHRRGILVMATNEPEELKWAESVLTLDIISDRD